MITDLFYTVIICLMIWFGWSRPCVALAAVLWVDTVKPQNTSFSFLSGKPLSLILTAFFFFTLIVNAKKLKRVDNKLFYILFLAFMVWVTLSHLNAQHPTMSAIKYDVVIKTLFLMFFIPFTISSRKDFEYVLSILFMASTLFITIAGVKSAMGGGGYGVSLIGLQGSGFMYSEGSMLATLAVCVIPLALYLANYSYLSDKKIFKYYCYFVIFCSLTTQIGTQARTGLVVLGIYLLLHLYYTHQKLKGIAFLLILGLVGSQFVTQDWLDRMQTIDEGTTTEKSAVGRIVVWRWTFDYVANKPILGGGFYAYLDNAGKLDQYGTEGEVIISQRGAKAYHNIYIEVLAETGYGGLLIFLLIIAHTLILNTKKYPHQEAWETHSSSALKTFTLLYCAGGMFINVAFYPWLYILYTISIAKDNLIKLKNDENQKNSH
ncbi:DUF5935 domain-containing protein [Catenovulum agarivorans]|uniref:DUF5935 domain-containing protein n=1 Tax=Catenovulum agarivorans TaxID=1172192 RepID=UPI0003142123|nr:DUF5935 domain-containing protein [Catenovulum agarivorans]